MPRRIDPSELGPLQRRVLAEIEPPIDINDLWIATPEEQERGLQKVYSELGLESFPTARAADSQHEVSDRQGRRTIKTRFGSRLNILFARMRRQTRALDQTSESAPVLGGTAQDTGAAPGRHALAQPGFQLSRDSAVLSAAGLALAGESADTSAVCPRCHATLSLRVQDHQPRPTGDACSGNQTPLDNASNG